MHPMHVWLWIKLLTGACCTQNECQDSSSFTWHHPCNNQTKQNFVTLQSVLGSLNEPLPDKRWPKWLFTKTHLYQCMFRFDDVYCMSFHLYYQKIIRGSTGSPQWVFFNVMFSVSQLSDSESHYAKPRWSWYSQQAGELISTQNT